MPKGDLRIAITDLSGNSMSERVEMDFQRQSGEPGTGGVAMEASVTMGSETELIITGLACRGGPGTMYRVSASTAHRRTYSFFQSIREGVVNQASDDIEFWVKPGDVADIIGPQFDQLPAKAIEILEQAQMMAAKPEDRDLVDASGSMLYERLGPLRKACLLNIVKKTSHPSSDRCLPEIESLLVCRQDRFFAFVDSGLPQRIQASSVYKSAPKALHEPLDGFHMANIPSFKTRDAHANLQVTFMQHDATGRLAADIDIDESSGIEHGFEVIRNAVFRNRTNPYLIREFMINADLQEHSLDPGYDFVF